jgi:hypothetical protein
VVEGAALEGESVVEAAAEGESVVDEAAAVVFASVDCSVALLGSAAVVLESVTSAVADLSFCLFLKSRHELPLIGYPQCSVIVLEVVAASISEQPLVIKHCSKRSN